MRLKHKLLIDYYLGGVLHAMLKPWVVLLGFLLKRDHDLTKCRTLTFLKLLGGGSLVIAYPALLALKQAPGVHRIRLVTSPAVKPFADSLSVFDEIIVIDDRSIARLLRDATAALWRLFRTDVIIDLEIHSRLTTVFCLLSCARNRVGFYTMDSFWRRELSTHLLFCNLARGVYYFYDQIAGLFGAGVPSFDHCIQRFHEFIAVPAARSTGRIGVAPCCSDLGRERMLEAGAWTAILASRCGLGSGVTEIRFFGVHADRPYLDQIIQELGVCVPGVTCLNHAGECTLAESVRLVAGLDELQCIDSALLHYARLLGVKTVSYWGPTDPETRLRRWPGCQDIVNYARIPCSPCVHLSYASPCHGNNVCMQAAVTQSRTLNPAWLAVPLVTPVHTLGRLPVLPHPRVGP